MDGSKIIVAACTAFAAACGTGIAVSASAGGGSDAEAYEGNREYDNRMTDQLAVRLLGTHNRERERLGLPRLKWNRALEREAMHWGHELAKRGRLEHADQRTRNSTGENLWMGSQGQWDIMVGFEMMTEEKKHYRHENFPQISTTGRWADVAHYTQIIWRDTKEVGCSVVNDHGWDVLVCRYWPAGNVWGQKAY